MAVVTETVAGKVIAAIMVTGTLVTMVISTITVRITLGKSDKSFKNSKDVGNDVDARVSFDHARHLALNYGLTGYDSLPPGIAKNPARGKPLPPGIAKKTVPADMLGQLPSYPGYEWRVVGDDWS